MKGGAGFNTDVQLKKKSNRIFVGKRQTNHGKGDLASAERQSSLWFPTDLGLGRVRRYQLLLAESKIPTRRAIPAAKKLNVSIKPWVVQSRITHMAPQRSI
jgi:hypothetical protein